MNVYKFDVVIVGGGFGGIKCADVLKDSSFKVALIEKKKEFGEKVCAGGITLEDLKYIPSKLINFPFKKIFFFFKNKKVPFPKEGEIISSIERKEVAKEYIKKIERSQNVELLPNTFAEEVEDRNTLKLKSGKRIKFKYLVGADGVLSIVRRYLRIPKKRIFSTLQYKIPKEMKDFEVYLDSKLFGTGYLWIFPHKGYTFVGCGTEFNKIHLKKLKKTLDTWIIKKEIYSKISHLKPESFLINADYRGYRFGNIFLAGDAAGLACGITGKGIYPAFLSGEQIGLEILGVKKKENLIYSWLKKKRQQEKFLIFLKNPWIREIFYTIVLKLLLYKNFSEKMKGLLT